MPIPANQIKVAEIAMQGIVAAGGSNPVNIQFLFHAQRATVSVAPSKAALETAFNANWSPPILAALNVGYTQTFNNVRWVNDATDPPVPTTRAGVGAIAGDRLSTFEAVYMLFRSGLKGRSYRGSKHFAPFSESDVGNDVLNAGAIVRVQAIATALATPLVDSTGNTWNLTVLSRNLSQLRVNPTTVVCNDVTVILFNRRIGRMKSRTTKSVY